MHGWDKRRSWVKLHVGVDEASSQIVAEGITGSNTHDDTAFPDLLSQTASAASQVSLDGAYDKEGSRRAIAAIGAVATIPPRKDALLAYLPPVRGTPAWEATNQRNLTLHELVRNGYSTWAAESGYTRRAAAEWTMSRFKRSFTGALRSRRPERSAGRSESQMRSPQYVVP